MVVGGCRWFGLLLGGSIGAWRVTEQSASKALQIGAMSSLLERVVGRGKIVSQEVLPAKVLRKASRSGLSVGC